MRPISFATHTSAPRRLLLSSPGHSDPPKIATSYSSRFKNVARLYRNYTKKKETEAQVLHRLQQAHVCIVGLGGVGSWVVEAVARSGIGEMTLVDMDDVCISNTNRQLAALTSTVGKFKAEVMRDRVLDINPSAKVHVMIDFLRPDMVDAVLAYSADGKTIDPSFIPRPSYHRLLIIAASNHRR